MEESLLTKIMKGLQIELGGTIGSSEPVAIQLLLWFFIFELAKSLLLAKQGENVLSIFKAKFTAPAFLEQITKKLEGEK